MWNRSNHIQGHNPNYKWINKHLLWLILLPILLTTSITACGQKTAITTATSGIETAQPTEIHTVQAEITTVPTGIEDTSSPPEIPGDALIFDGDPLPTSRERFFSASGACTICHTQMVDEGGQDVSIDTHWRASMMANAARDPYWQASVREEIINFPEFQPLIEETCARCHMPMASVTLSADGQTISIFGDGLTNVSTQLHPLAMDGVSCTLCHQITENQLGEPESFSGGFDVDLETSTGERLIYSPFEIEANYSQVMKAVSGFIPTMSEHVTQSRLCATCHTLYTATIDASGTVSGTFPEQTPFLEWLGSEYVNTQSCQDCHMPIAEGEVLTSTTGGSPRAPFHKHYFVGGNSYIQEIFRTFGQEMDVTASSEQFADTQQRTLNNLQESAADITITDIQQSGNELLVTVAVEALTGHKLPTGYPSRRVWIHFVITDNTGNVVFESGNTNPDGSIVGNANDSDPREYEPHYQLIEEQDQVQIYETIIVNTEGELTTILLQSAAYIKDNRILPKGLEPQEAIADIQIWGGATSDQDFIAGGDTITYRINLDDSIGTYEIDVSLLYQSLGYRWIENLIKYQAEEIDRFREYTHLISNEPILLAQDQRSYETDTESPSNTIDSNDLRISIVYDNLQYEPNFLVDWGFAAFIEYDDKLILFDTGGNGQILLANMEQFGIDPTEINTVIFSHIHGDHTGGIDALLDAGARPTIYLLPSFSASFKRSMSDLVEVVEVTRGMQIDTGIYTTGEMINGVPEQALIIQTDQGLIVMTGCAHPGIAHMVRRASDIFDSNVYLVIGGFHLGSMGQADIRDILAQFRSLNVQWVSPCHCTGELAISLFAEEYGDNYIQCGAGLILNPNMDNE